MNRAIVRESFLSVLVLRRDSLAKLEINKGLMTTALTSWRTGRKKIDMVAACGFHSGHDSREVFTVRSNSLHQSRKPLLSIAADREN